MQCKKSEAAEAEQRHVGATPPSFSGCARDATVRAGGSARACGRRAMYC